MSKKDLRTILFEENFMQHFQEGYNAQEIALKYNVSIWSMYKLLDGIAKANNVTRDSPLQRPHAQHQRHIIIYNLPKEPVNPEKLLEDYNETIQYLDNALSSIKSILQED